MFSNFINAGLSTIETGSLYDAMKLITALFKSINLFDLTSYGFLSNSNCLIDVDDFSPLSFLFKHYV